MVCMVYFCVCTICTFFSSGRGREGGVLVCSRRGGDIFQGISICVYMGFSIYSYKHFKFTILIHLCATNERTNTARRRSALRAPPRSLTENINTPCGWVAYILQHPTHPSQPILSLSPSLDVCCTYARLIFHWDGMRTQKKQNKKNNVHTTILQILIFLVFSCLQFYQRTNIYR